MKKFVFVFVVVVILLSTACTAVLADYATDKVSFYSLPADSKFAGTYFGYFCKSETRCGEDADQFSAWDVFFNKPHIHMDQMVGSRAYLSLDARPDYEWVWKQGNMFHDGAYYLEKK